MTGPRGGPHAPSEIETVRCACGREFQRRAYHSGRRTSKCADCTILRRHETQAAYDERKKREAADNPANPPRAKWVRASRAKDALYAKMPKRECPKCGKEFPCGPASGAVLCPPCALSGMPDYTPRSVHPLADL